MKDGNTYKITLADGTELNDLEMNGNNFISAARIDQVLFENNCSPVTISDGENTETHDNMTLVQVTRMGDKYWFILRDMTEDELYKIKVQADLEYLAMMTNVDLD